MQCWLAHAAAEGTSLHGPDARPAENLAVAMMAEPKGDIPD